MIDSVSVTLVVLSYNSESDLEACMKSVGASTDGPNEIIIIDNASKDRSIDVIQRIMRCSAVPYKLIQLPTNLGCAGGNNCGWRDAKSEIIVFLNPDTEVDNSFFSAVREAFEDTSVGIVGARIFYPDSQILQHAGGIIHPNGMTQHLGYGQVDQEIFQVKRDVDYVTGAGFAIRRSLLETLNGFREAYYPAYFEETDLCTRVKKMGHRVMYDPQIVMVHKESVSLGVESRQFRKLYQRMRIRYLLLNTVGCQWRKVLGFEKWWWQQPFASGYRLEQVRAYLEAILWKLRLMK